jgi:hypothetical protein
LNRLLGGDSIPAMQGAQADWARNEEVGANVQRRCGAPAALTILRGSA